MNLKIQKLDSLTCHSKGYDTHMIVKTGHMSIIVKQNGIPHLFVVFSSSKANMIAIHERGIYVIRSWIHCVILKHFIAETRDCGLLPDIDIL